MVGVKYIASVSYGKDSCAMLLELIKRKCPIDYVVFYDTGMEFDAIYDVKSTIENQYGSYAEFVTLRRDVPFEYDMCSREVHKKNGCVQYGYKWCGGMCRWGTTDKIAKISSFKKSIGDSVTDYVGIAFDEPKRVEKANAKTLPLVEWKMTEADCLKYCYDNGIFWEQDGIRLYDILDRVSCWCCKNKNMKELRNIFHYMPSYWERLKQLQSQIDIPFKGFYADGSPKGIFELERRFKEEDDAVCK